MYLEFFGLEKEPFNLTPDSSFLFLSSRHREALAALLYGIENRKGFMALTGEIGSGKTTICRALLRELDRDRHRIALILNPELSDLELLQSINHEYDLPCESTSKRELLATLNKFLLAELAAGRTCVLLIDESQRLSPKALEQVRLISNLETETAKLIQIALIGQPELDDLLHLKELEQLNQRITVRFHIGALTFEEMGDYITHRLAVAKPTKEIVFHKKALRRIFENTGGVPRRINVVCDRALLVAFTKGSLEISGEIAETAIAEVSARPPRRRPSRAETPAPEDAAPAAVSPADSAPTHAEASGSRAGLVAVSILLGFGLLAVALRPGTGTATPGNGDQSLPSPATVATPTATPAPTRTTAASPTATPSPTHTPRPSPTASASPTPSATPEPSPTPPPTRTALPTGSPTPMPTASPSRTPEPSPTQTPKPSESPTPAPSPTATATSTATAAATPAESLLLPPRVTTTPTDSATSVTLDWTYEPGGGVRVTRAELAYPACVISWLGMRGKRFPESELVRLRAEKADVVSKYQLTTGAGPLYLREARLPANLSILPRDLLPILVQVDRTSRGFGPWCLLTERRNGQAVLFDPRRGGVATTDIELEEHVAGVAALYEDREGLTDLKPGAKGEAVRALQRRLARLGHYRGNVTGEFDESTLGALQQFTINKGLPLAKGVDPVTALALLRDTAGAPKQ